MDLGTNLIIDVTSSADKLYENDFILEFLTRKEQVILNYFDSTQLNKIWFTNKRIFIRHTESHLKTKKTETFRHIPYSEIKYFSIQTIDAKDEYYVSNIYSNLSIFCTGIGFITIQFHDDKDFIKVKKAGKLLSKHTLRKKTWSNMTT